MASPKYTQHCNELQCSVDDLSFSQIESISKDISDLIKEKRELSQGFKWLNSK